MARLTPEQAATLGLPVPAQPASAARLTPDQAVALGLPAEPGPDLIPSHEPGADVPQKQSLSRRIAGVLAPGAFGLTKGTPENLAQREAYQTLTAPLVGDDAVAPEQRVAALDALPASGLLIGSSPQAPAPMARGPVRSLLRRGAEGAAVRATNADRTALDRAAKGSEEVRHQIGAFLLDEKIPLRSPQAIKGAAQGVAAEAGQEIGAAIKAADATGATVDLAGAINAAKSSNAVARLNRNTKSRAAYEDIVRMLDDQFQQNGGRIPPSKAHDIRMQLDELADWDKAAPAGVKKGWRVAREAIDKALSEAMDSSGQGVQWDAANARFSMSRKLTNPANRGLADVGVKRREGNRLGSPSEQGAVLLGGMTAAMVDPITGMAIPAGTVAAKRFGMPAAARVLDWLAQPAPAPVSVLPAQAGRSASLEALLRAMAVRPRLASSAAGEEEPQ